MGSVFLKTMIMFMLAFIISMFVALLIYWIRILLTSVRMNSFFDEKSKILVKRAIRIHKIHDKQISMISEAYEKKSHPELFDFFEGIGEGHSSSEEIHSTVKPYVRRKHSVKKHKNI